MVQFPISPSPNKTKLEHDFTYLKKYGNNTRQVELLEQRANKLYERNRWIPTRASRVQEILGIIHEVRTQISAIVQLDTMIPNEEVHRKCRDIIREGARELNSKRTRSASRIESDRLKEEDAIRRDQESIEEAIQQQASPLAPFATTEVKIYKLELDAPIDENLLIISEPFSCYGDLEWHLHGNKLVLEPDLWRRLEEKHGFSEDGRIWDIPLFDQPIDSNVLCVVSRKCRRFAYTLALAHQFGGEEVPVPLDVVPFYDVQTEDKGCCTPSCRSLRQHLRVRWPNQWVITAKSLKAPHIPSVVDVEFHASRFLPGTNSLYFSWKPIQAASAPT
ncbi:hypothetical protein M408DRAFT_334235 [Serendipita vermifera MAFF 305830]|uniref:Uncharacterized protein n=1 Tax=Serendipita vermifera MAFF 305830 TaxID=933852 RepID=A0A0C2WQF6_SERVB|nr:hypothetical protein M408DRAFT_334235 [Serendipita vermifera MAFF 305830]